MKKIHQQSLLMGALLCFLFFLPRSGKTQTMEVQKYSQGNNYTLVFLIHDLPDLELRPGLDTVPFYTIFMYYGDGMVEKQVVWQGEIPNPLYFVHEYESEAEFNNLNYRPYAEYTKSYTPPSDPTNQGFIHPSGNLGNFDGDLPDYVINRGFEGGLDLGPDQHVKLTFTRHIVPGKWVGLILTFSEEVPDTCLTYAELAFKEGTFFLEGLVNTPPTDPLPNTFGELSCMMNPIVEIPPNPVPCSGFLDGNQNYHLSLNAGDLFGSNSHTQSSIVVYLKVENIATENPMPEVVFSIPEYTQGPRGWDCGTQSVTEQMRDSYDPNDKTAPCQLAVVLSQQKIPITYQITFSNEGNWPVDYVRVKDTLPCYLSYSQTTQIEVGGNTLVHAQGDIWTLDGDERARVRIVRGAPECNREVISWNFEDLFLRGKEEVGVGGNGEAPFSGIITFEVLLDQCAYPDGINPKVALNRAAIEFYGESYYDENHNIIETIEPRTSFLTLCSKTILVDSFSNSTQWCLPDTANVRTADCEEVSPCNENCGKKFCWENETCKRNIVCLIPWLIGGAIALALVVFFLIKRN